LRWTGNFSGRNLRGVKTEPKDVRFRCPKCDRKMVALEFVAKEIVTCPDCGTAFIPDKFDPPPPPIKFSCPQCSCPIEAPAEKLGQEMDCPHCRMRLKVRHMIEPEKQPSTSVSAGNSSSSPTRIENSLVATAFTMIAILEFIAAPLVAISLGQRDGQLAIVIFVSSILSGLFLLGFARVTDCLYESAQRLRKIEYLLQKAENDKMQPKA
jgi:DNA-directed RNA polymerase subunit RPC12/RpoP